MRYHNITKDDMRNGDGLRTVLWVSGCSHECVGCHNKITWNGNDGVLFDEEAKKELFDALGKDYVSGLTLSGGDPLFLENRDDILMLVQEVKRTFKDKTVWLYTGFTFDEIKELEVLEYVDVLVDGKFVLEERDVTLYWRGSRNQRVIDVKKSKKENKVVLYCE